MIHFTARFISSKFQRELTSKVLNIIFLPLHPLKLNEWFQLGFGFRSGSRPSLIKSGPKIENISPCTGRAITSRYSSTTRPICTCKEWMILLSGPIKVGEGYSQSQCDSHLTQAVTIRLQCTHNPECLHCIMSSLRVVIDTHSDNIHTWMNEVQIKSYMFTF